MRTAAMTSVRRSRSAPSSSRLMPEPFDDLRRDAERTFAQRPALVGEGDVEGALVAGVAVPGDVPLRLEALEQRRERRGLELQRLAEVAHGARVALPEREHHEVLRVRESERLEDRPVEPDDAARRDREGEAHLVLEGEQVVGCRGPRGFGARREFGHQSPIMLDRRPSPELFSTLMIMARSRHDGDEQPRADTRASSTG